MRIRPLSWRVWHDGWRSKCHRFVIEKREGTTPFGVRWTMGGQSHVQWFMTAEQAKAFAEDQHQQEIKGWVEE
jgi:hypothetical protein